MSDAESTSSEVDSSSLTSAPSERDSQLSENYSIDRPSEVTTTNLFPRHVDLQSSPLGKLFVVDSFTTQSPTRS